MWETPIIHENNSETNLEDPSGSQIISEDENSQVEDIVSSINNAASSSINEHKRRLVKKQMRNSPKKN